MDKIDRGIREGNHLPGTERYTKPEEIKALGKFLRAGIDKRDSVLELGEDNLAAPKTDPRYIETVELSKTFETIDGRTVEALDTTRLGLDTEENIELSSDPLKLKKGSDTDLSGVRLDIDDPGEDLELSTKSYEISKGQDPSLSDILETIVGGDSDISLGDSRLELTDTSERLETLPETYESLEVAQEELKLSEGPVELNDPGAKDLSEYTESLISGGSVSELPGITGEELERLNSLSQEVDTLNTPKDVIEELPNKTTEVLEGKIEPKLSDLKVEGPKNNDKNSELSKKSEKIEENKKISKLSNHKESGPKIKDPEKLGKHKEEIKKKKDKALETEALTLKKSEDLDKLGKYKEEIKKPKDVGLSESKPKIKDSREIKISREKDEIKKPKDQELEDFKDTIKETKENKLDNQIRELKKAKDVELSEFKPGIKDSRETRISQKKEEIKKKEVSELETHKEEIDQSPEVKLRDDSDTITEKKVDDLPNSRKNLDIGKKETKLSESKEQIYSKEDPELVEKPDYLEDNKEVSLSSERKTIKSNEEAKLSTKVQQVQEKKITDLGQKQEKITVTETPNLSTKKIDLENKEQLELSGKSEKFQDNRNPELSKEKRELQDQTKVESLSNFSDTLQKDQDIELSNEKVEIDKGNDVELSDILDDLFDSRDDSELYDNSIELQDLREEAKLSDVLLREPKETEVELSDILIKEASEKEVELSDIRIEEPYETEVELSDILIKEASEKEVELSDFVDKEASEEEVELSDFVDKEATEEEVELSDFVDKEASEKEVTLSDILIREASRKEVDLSDKLEYRPEEIEGRNSQERTETNFYSYTEATDLDWLNLSPEDKNKLSEIKKELSGMGPWGEKVDIYLTNLLSGTAGSFIPESKTEAYKELFKVVDLPEREAEIPEDFEDKEVTLSKSSETIKDNSKYSFTEEPEGVPEYKLGKFNLLGGGLNINKYLRWTAEKTVGRIGKGATKTKLINETLLLLTDARDLLEKTTNSRPYRLPGGTSSLFGNQGITLKGVATAAGNLFSNVKQNPYNRPKGGEGSGLKSGLFGGTNEASSMSSWIAPGQKVLDYKDNDSDISNPKGFFKKAAKNLIRNLTGNQSASSEETRKFSDYLPKKEILDATGRNFGMGTSLSYLFTSDVDTEDVTLDDLMESARTSYRITTPEKFTSTKYATNYFTLDSNHIWEVVLRPYVGELNANCTWLPSFGEIDLENKSAFNITTNYSKGWLPITGYELQDKKITSKELPLFDGNLSYPVSMEMTNELRLTFADDSLKSLRRYFELSAKTSIYMSNIHNDGDWGDVSEATPDILLYQSVNNPTVILENKIHPALYKNVSFLITIMVMTPQMATIKKCDLLCVLKDFSFEYQGETDASPTELAITFSIVGENPPDSKITGRPSVNYFYITKENKNQPNFGDSILNNLGGAIGSIF